MDAPREKRNRNWNWVFDINGTVCDAGTQAPLKAMIAAFAEQGLDNLTAQDLVEHMGLGIEDHVSQLVRTHELDNKVDIAHFHKCFADHLDRLLRVPNACELFLGLPALFRELRAQGDRLLHITSLTHHQVEPVLAFWEREYDYVPDVVVCSDDPAIKYGRPAPDIIEVALSRLEGGTSDLEDEDERRRTIAVSDSLPSLRAGANAGLLGLCAIVESGAWSSGTETVGEHLSKLQSVTPHVYRTTQHCIQAWKMRKP